MLIFFIIIYIYLVASTEPVKKRCLIPAELVDFDELVYELIKNIESDDDLKIVNENDNIVTAIWKVLQKRNEGYKLEYYEEDTDDFDLEYCFFMDDNDNVELILDEIFPPEKDFESIERAQGLGFVIEYKNFVNENIFNKTGREIYCNKTFEKTDDTVIQFISCNIYWLWKNKIRPNTRRLPSSMVTYENDVEDDSLRTFKFREDISRKILKFEKKYRPGKINNTEDFKSVKEFLNNIDVKIVGGDGGIISLSKNIINGINKIRGKFKLKEINAKHIWDIGSKLKKDSQKGLAKIRSIISKREIKEQFSSLKEQSLDSESSPENLKILKLDGFENPNLISICKENIRYNMKMNISQDDDHYRYALCLPLKEREVKNFETENCQLDPVWTGFCPNKLIDPDCHIWGNGWNWLKSAYNFIIEIISMFFCYKRDRNKCRNCFWIHGAPDSTQGAVYPFFIIKAVNILKRFFPSFDGTDPHCEDYDTLYKWLTGFFFVLMFWNPLIEFPKNWLCLIWMAFPILIIFIITTITLWLVIPFVIFVIGGFYRDAVSTRKWNIDLDKESVLLRLGKFKNRFTNRYSKSWNSSIKGLQNDMNEVKTNILTLTTQFKQQRLNQQTLAQHQNLSQYRPTGYPQIVTMGYQQI